MPALDHLEAVADHQIIVTGPDGAELRVSDHLSLLRLPDLLRLVEQADQVRWLGPAELEKVQQWITDFIRESHPSLSHETIHETYFATIADYRDFLSQLLNRRVRASIMPVDQLVQPVASTRPTPKSRT